MSPKTVFISYAREDKTIAKKLYYDLEKAGVSPWMDTRDLLPGQAWQSTIMRVLKKTDYVLILLSRVSLSKRGFVQKETKRALDILDDFPTDSIYILPVRLDDCAPLDEKLNSLHMVDLFPSYDEGVKQLLKVF